MKKNGYGSNASDSSGTPKTKFQSFNANALLPKASHASPNVPQRGYGTGGGGMQMLGRSSGARANPAAPLPVNLPSIKRETTGSIGSASPGTWGSRPMGFSGSALAQSPPSNLSAKPSLDRPSVRTGLSGTSSPAAKDASGPAPAWGGKGIPTLANNEESISTPATAKPSVGPGPSAGDAPQGQGDPSFPSLGAKPLSAPAGAAKVESAPTVVRTTREAAGELSDWAEDPEETMNFSMPLELEFVTTKASEGAEREAATEGAKGADVEAESEAHPETLQDTKGTQPSASNEGKGLRFVAAKKSSVTIPQAKPTLGGEGAEAQPSTNSESAGEPAPETTVVNKPATPQGHGLADGQREILRQKAEERRREEEERVRVQKERSMAKLKELEQRIFERSSQQPKALQDNAVQKTEHVNSGADSRTTGLSDPSEEGGRERSAVESSSNELVDESSQNKNTGSTPARWSEIDSTTVPTSQLESSGMVKSILTRPSKSTESTGLESTPDEASQKHLVVGGPEEAPVKVVVDEHEAAGRQSSSSPAKDHGEGSAPSSMENKPSSGSPKLQSSRRSDRQKDSTVNAPSSPKSHRNNERNVEAAPSMDPHHSPTVKRGRAGVHEGTHKGVLQKNRDRSAHKEEGTEGVVHMVLNSEDNVESSVTGRKKVQRDKLSKRIKLKKVNTPRGDDAQNREIGDSRAEAGQGPKVNEDSGGWQKVKKAPVTSKSSYDERRSSRGDRYGVVEKSKSASETPDAHEGVEDDAGSDGWKEVKARRPDRKKFNHPQSQQVGRKDRRQRSPVEGYQDIGRKQRDSRSGDTSSARVAKPVEARQVEGGEKVPTTTEEKVWQMKQPVTASPLHSAEANVEAATASKPGASYHSVARNGQRPRSYVDSVQGVRPEASEPSISQRTSPKPNASQPAGTAEAYSNGEDHNQSARATSAPKTAWQIKPMESPNSGAETPQPAHMYSKPASSPEAEESKASADGVSGVGSKDSAGATKGSQQKDSPRPSKEHESFPPGGKKPNLKKARNQNKRGKAYTVVSGDPTVPTVPEPNPAKPGEGESGIANQVDAGSKSETPAKKHHQKDRKTEKPASTLATRGRARMSLKGKKATESGGGESAPVLPDSLDDRKGQDLPDARGGEQVTKDRARSPKVEKAQKSRKNVKKSESVPSPAPRSSPERPSSDSKNGPVADWKPSVEDSRDPSWGSDADPKRDLPAPKLDPAKVGVGKEPQEGTSRNLPKRDLNRKKPSSRRKPYSDRKQSKSSNPEGSPDTAVEGERATEGVQEAQYEVAKPRKLSSRLPGKGTKGEAKGVTGDQVWVEKVSSTKAGIPGISEAQSSPKADSRVEPSGKNAAVATEADGTSTSRHKSKNLSWEVKKKDSQSEKNDQVTPTVRTNGNEMDGGKPVWGPKKGFRPNTKKRTPGGRGGGGFKAVYVPKDRSDDVGKEASTQPTQSTEA